jgi:hypothetical protein
MDSTVKTAKKILKKSDKDSIKIKQLVKTVLEKLKDNNEPLSSSQVKDWIINSNIFTVDGKIVSLNSSKKRKEVSDSTENGREDDEKAKKKAAKRAKKEAKKKDESSCNQANTSPSGGCISAKDAQKWRTENKVVLKDTKDNGDDASNELDSSEAYLPYDSFDSPKCKANINSVFLKQCTEVNGFKKPSAIQAQCWPVLLNTDNGKRRDVVGYVTMIIYVPFLPYNL